MILNYRAAGEMERQFAGSRCLVGGVEIAQVWFVDN